MHVSRLGHSPCTLALFVRAVCFALLLGSPLFSPVSSAGPLAVHTPPPPTLRLPTSARPTGYQLHLQLQPGADQFSGTIEIALHVNQPLALLWLNAAPEVQIDRAEFFSNDPAHSRIAVLGQERSGRDFLGLRPAATLTVGAWTLRMQYHARLLKNEGVGLFTEHDNGDDYIFTDLEALDARRAFPCFDEPEYKVPLQLTLDVPAAHTAAANAPIAREEPLPGRPEKKRVTFAKTPPLPTYLWAIAVGPFGVVPAGKGGKKGVPLRILTLRGREAEGRYAAQVTAPLIDLLERYTGVPFPYDKLDQVAVPNQSHAMENPGLITYGLRTIQIRPDEETVAARRRFAQVCAHELAHHWTGDLVTLRFWDDLWLNESFASFLDSKITEQFQPSWEEPLERVASRATAMDNDSLLSARRIRQPIHSNDDIVNAFDPITYAKGKAVLGMLEDWLGPAVFQRGLTRYLTTHAHGTAVADDFLRALTAEAQSAGKAREASLVSHVAASFLDQPGVPLVSLSLACQAGPPRLRWSQQRYLPLSPPGTDSAADAALHYRVPLCFAVDNQPTRCEVISGDRGEITLPGRCPQSVLADPASRGYYRVLYDAALFDPLVARAFPRAGSTADRELAQPLALSPIARLGFLRNVDAGLRRGDIPLARVLPLLPAMAADPSRHIVGISTSLATMLRDYVTPSERPVWQAEVHGLYAQRLQSMGLRMQPQDDDNTRLLRSSILPLALGDAGRTPTVATLQGQAEALLTEWLVDRRALDAETAHALALSAPQQAGQGLWQKILDAVRREPDRVRRSVLFSALGSFRDPALAASSMALLLDPAFSIRETLPLLLRLASFPETREAANAFVQTHFDALVARLPRDGGAGLARVFSGFCDSEKASAAARFFDGRSTKYVGGPRILRQSSERAQKCDALRRRYAPELQALLRPAARPPAPPSAATRHSRQSE